jgi:hypothetical protein
MDRPKRDDGDRDRHTKNMSPSRALQPCVVDHCLHTVHHLDCDRSLFAQVCMQETQGNTYTYTYLHVRGAKGTR